MSTTSSFPARRLSAPLLALGLVVTLGLAGGCRADRTAREVQAPDAPLPARAVVERPAAIDHSILTRPVALRSVRVSRLGEGSEIGRLAGRRFLDEATEPLVIVVELAEELDQVPRDSAPVIVLNGQPLVDTWPRPGTPSTLVAFLPNTELIRQRNTVAAVWLGSEELTMSEEPLVFSAEEVGTEPEP